MPDEKDKVEESKDNGTDNSDDIKVKLEPDTVELSRDRELKKRKKKDLGIK